MAQRAGINDLRIARMNADAADLARVAKANVFPGFARVGRFINAVPVRDIPAYGRFSHTSIDHVRVGFRDGDGPDRTCLEVFIRDRLPAEAAIRGLPDP